MTQIGNVDFRRSTEVDNLHLTVIGTSLAGAYGISPRFKLRVMFVLRSSRQCSGEGPYCPSGR